MLSNGIAKCTVANVLCTVSGRVLWVYFGCTLGVLWVYFGCTLGAI